MLELEFTHSFQPGGGYRLGGEVCTGETDPLGVVVQVWHPPRVPGKERHREKKIILRFSDGRQLVRMEKSGRVVEGGWKAVRWMPRVGQSSENGGGAS